MASNQEQGLQTMETCIAEINKAMKNYAQAIHFFYSVFYRYNEAAKPGDPLVEEQLLEEFIRLRMPLHHLIHTMIPAGLIDQNSVIAILQLEIVVVEYVKKYFEQPDGEAIVHQIDLTRVIRQYADLLEWMVLNNMR